MTNTLVIYVKRRIKNELLKYFYREKSETAGGVISEFHDHDGMQYLSKTDNSLSFKAFQGSLHGSDTYINGSLPRKEYIDSQIQRLYRVFSKIYALKDEINGPFLDVASGWGILYPAFKQLLFQVLPYHIAELSGEDMVIDGDIIDYCKFECERDRLKHPDETFGVVSFIDCLEHLIVDPVWTILEFNRVMRVGGHIIIGTPNAAAAFRILKMLNGHTPATESEYKPSSIYQRHNREWTPLEIGNLLKNCGFENVKYSTNTQLMASEEMQVLQKLNECGFVNKPFHYYGPELFVVATKQRHVTVDSDLSRDIRWPAWLYTSFDAYRRRPDVFPIVVSDDYK